MASVYPGSLDVFTDKTDGVDYNLAAHINEMQDAIEAVEEELGTDPAGTHATVKDRLDDHNHTSGDGVQIPTGGIENNAVTYVKMQNVSATNMVLGRSSAGAGVVEEIIMSAQARSLVALTNMFVDTADFIPVLEGTTTNGVGTYAVQEGRYSRIGSVVYFSLILSWTAHTGTGNMIITGLPLTAENTVTFPCSVTWLNITLGAVGNKILAYVQNNTPYVYLREIGSGSRTLIPMDTSGRLEIAGFYFV